MYTYKSALWKRDSVMPLRSESDQSTALPRIDGMWPLVPTQCRKHAGSRKELAHLAATSVFSQQLVYKCMLAARSASFFSGIQPWESEVRGEGDESRLEPSPRTRNCASL
jgi:hypothetical protein